MDRNGREPGWLDLLDVVDVFFDLVGLVWDGLTFVAGLVIDGF